MTDISQTNLKEPEQVDWENYGKTYVPPPAAVDAAGEPIVYTGVIEAATETDADEDYLNFQLDLRITDEGPGKGVRLRTWASTKPFQKDGRPLKGNPNKLANFLRAAGLAAKPQLNSEYRASVNAAKVRPVRFVIDWEARNKDTGEKVKGFLNFPEDPDRPGMRKTILHAGDVVTERDAKGNITGTAIIKSDVLFANARLRYFKDATPRVSR